MTDPAALKRPPPRKDAPRIPAGAGPAFGARPGLRRVPVA